MLTSIAHRLFLFSPPRDEGEVGGRRRIRKGVLGADSSANDGSENNSSRADIVSDRPNDPAEIALVERLRQDDAGALDELARRYMLPLSGLASALLESNALVDDVVQDVFLSVWEHRATLDVRTNVLGYLQRAVYNRVFNVLRHERSQLRKASSAVGLDVDVSRVARNEAEQRLDDEDLEARLSAALAHVPPSPRRVFLLSWKAGLTYNEIARLLGMTTRSVTKQMYRATQRLAVHFRRDL